MWLSLITSRCNGERASLNLVSIVSCMEEEVDVAYDIIIKRVLRSCCRSNSDRLCPAASQAEVERTPNFFALTMRDEANLGAAT